MELEIMTFKFYEFSLNDHYQFHIEMTKEEILI